jgi:hypothetical protein
MDGQGQLQYYAADDGQDLTPYSKSESGAVQYGEAYTTDGERQIFGFVGLVLRLENQAPVHSPTVRQLGSAVQSRSP